MAREGEKRSRIRRRKKGCLTGCLTNILLVLGVLSALFVGAHLLGFVQTNPETGAPSISFDHVGLDNLPEIKLDEIKLPDLSGMAENLPKWAYRINANGLTVKTLHAGDGEAVLVCADGYTLLLGAGSGKGFMLCAQVLLCGVNRLSAAVLMNAEASGGMSMALNVLQPEYLFVQEKRNGGSEDVIKTAEKRNIKTVSASQGLSFTLGRAQVTFIGATTRTHSDARDDGLSLRIDYGSTSVVVMGGITAAGEKEIAASNANLRCNVLIAASGGSDAATSAELVSAAKPQVAFLTGKNPSDSVCSRLEKSGVQVCTMKKNGVLTLYSNGENISIET